MASSSRRKENKTDDSMMSTTPSLMQDVDDSTQHLLGALTEIDLNSISPPVTTILQRWLSINSVISTASSSAIRQQEAAEDRDRRVFRSIGKGMCAEIFHQIGTERVLKRAFRPQNLQLWNDFEWHARILYKLKPAFENFELELSVPGICSYINRENQAWWDKNRDKFPRELREPTDLLESQMIQPLPKVVRYALIEKFCPPQLQTPAKADPANRDCLMRVYLGRRRGQSVHPVDFKLRNFEADLAVFEQLGLDQEVSQHARVMAHALAEMHWNVGTDAADVEFVLGTAPARRFLKFAEVRDLPPRSNVSVLDLKHRSVHLWLLDFNQCGEITRDDAGVDSAVNAFWENDPYYPRPVPPTDQDHSLWEVFRTGYLKHSSSILGPESQLAEAFIDRVIQEAQRRSPSASGPPRGGPPSGGEEVVLDPKEKVAKKIVISNRDVE